MPDNLQSDQPIEIRSILLSEINDGRGLSLLIDIGETLDNGLFQVPLFTYRNFLRHEGLTVEQSLASLGIGITAEMGVQVPLTLIDEHWDNIVMFVRDTPNRRLRSYIFDLPK